LSIFFWGRGRGGAFGVCGLDLALDRCQWRRPHAKLAGVGIERAAADPFDPLTMIDSVETPGLTATFGLDWPGKNEARALASALGIGQLHPRPQDSVDWETTANLMIEGENLEALKVLAATHTGAIKLAYLDPPYHLGRGVVYADASGERAAWLAMIYARLLAVRDLLADDGVVCISIDDTELAYLRLLCDEVFAERNFVATFVWETKRAARGVPPRSLLMHNHEYVICYAKDRAKVRLRGIDRDDGDFVNPDGDPRGPWRSESMKATGIQHNYFTIVDPRSGAGFHANWAFSRESVEQMIADGRVLFPPTPNGTPRQKKYRSSYMNDTKAAVTSLGWHSTERATKDLMRLFDGDKPFSFPKPLSLLEFFCGQLLRPAEVVLDVFAGSGTTGHAVMNLNARDGGERRFILVQQPEPLVPAMGAQRAAAAVCDRLRKPRTIAELTKERLRRASANVRAEHGCGDGIDLGFRVFELRCD
jgi:adenine-specific DNA-methyltransferase